MYEQYNINVCFTCSQSLAVWKVRKNNVDIEKLQQYVVINIIIYNNICYLSAAN